MKFFMLLTFLAALCSNAFGQTMENVVELKGKGDDSQAFAMAYKLAQFGNGEAMAFVGDALIYGSGINKDIELGIKYLERAGQHGYSNGWTWLGILFERGDVLPQSFVRAAMYFEKSAGFMDAYAQARLAYFYMSGKGVAKSYAEAARYAVYSARQGNSDAQTILGLLYSEGKGIERNLLIAHMWLNIAASQGNDFSATARDRLENQLTGPQIQAAELKAQRCQRTSYREC